MKIGLLITVCETYKERIVNQIYNLSKNVEFLVKNNINPIFCIGNINLSIDIPYELWKFDVKETYSYSYKKVFLSYKKAFEENYDYIIKIDDDTLFNLKNFDKINLSYDYIGRFIENTKNVIDINIPMFNLKDTIELYPSLYKETFRFATGDFYILSKKSLEYISTKDDIINEIKEEEYVCEDQLFGFILNKNSNIRKHDIIYKTNDTDENLLQVTKDIISIHPIKDVLFKKIADLDINDQLNFIFKSKSNNVLYRKILLENLKKDFKKVLLDFGNKKKSMGMG